MCLLDKYSHQICLDIGQDSISWWEDKGKRLWWKFEDLNIWKESGKGANKDLI